MTIDTKNNVKALAWEWIESLAVAFLLAMVIRTFFIQPFKIPSGSMRMTLIEGDRLFVNKLNYGASVPLTDYRLPGYGHPSRGDVLVFKYPVQRNKDFIKRLIAVGGETVEIKDGRVFINDREVVEGPIARIHYYNYGEYAQPGKKITVPKGYYFVMGDNSGSSHDSRYWGFVPEALIVGKAEVIFWPPNRIRLIK
ncbi:MAG: signal peptidase I [Candidatus Omnitrophica bacterium]|nr:signal peptidase I [Candidatus Omnitrophota bacterium]